MDNSTYSDINPAKWQKVILVEGTHDKKFVSKIISKFDDLQAYSIVPYNGIDNLEKVLDSLVYSQIPDFQAHTLLEKIYITIDAAAFSKILQYLLNLNTKHANQLPTPTTMNTFEKVGKIALGIYVIPNNNSNGCLESLILETVNSQYQPILNITNECAKQVITYHTENDKEYKATFSQEEKMKHRLYVDSIGVKHNHTYDKATEDGFNLNSDALQNFINFLK